MKRSLVVGGSILVVVIIALASFPSVVGNQASLAQENSFLNKLLELQSKINLKDYSTTLSDINWEPGEIIIFLIYLVVVFLYALRYIH